MTDYTLLTNFLYGLQIAFGICMIGAGMILVLFGVALVFGGRL